MGKKLKAAFSAVCNMVHIEGPHAKFTDEIFTHEGLPPTLDIAMLCNPFHDKGLEEMLDNYYIPRKVDIFVDSGGFQLLVGKFKGDKERFKEDIYQMMSKYADYAFCFDENPIDANRVYHHDRALPALEETNKNIRRQIEVFKANNSKAKVLGIYHIKEDDRDLAGALFDGVDTKYIAGISFNSLTWGGSGTNDFGKMAFFNEVREKYKIPNMVHLLSYGELKIVCPFIVLQHFGFMGEDNVISVDSSSYTLGLRRWGFVPKLDGGARRIPAKNNNGKEWYAFRDWCVKKYGDALSERFKATTHEDTRCKSEDALIHTAGFLYAARQGYINMMSDPVGFALKYGYMKEGQIKSLEILARTKTFDEYKEWRSEYGVAWGERKRMTDSTSKPKSTLDAFF